MTSKNGVDDRRMDVFVTIINITKTLHYEWCKHEGGERCLIYMDLLYMEIICTRLLLLHKPLLDIC